MTQTTDRYGRPKVMLPPGPPVPPRWRYMDSGRLMKASDIPDETVVRVLAVTEPIGHDRDQRDVLFAVAAEIGPVPWRVWTAKARKLNRRGLVHSCLCGCGSGSWHLPAECTVPGGVC